eukprot:TRINITY_DN42946_c0_g1_i1.p1 TRINITY_DN42946_c0_g1~~TRINITY_DN42946_c0_g1_i1.p1  ORF type:complete len:1046 (-),score=206.37 TRINITY_DN42946_c0_g1_i1:138-3068(-)
MDGSPLAPSAEAFAAVAEQSLSSLKSFSSLAHDEVTRPLSDAAGSSQVRWEIYSTWRLLLFLHHAEADSARCQRRKPKSWSTEGEALRFIFLSHRSARSLAAILQWLRWVHRRTPGREEIDEESAMHDGGCDASFEETRKAVHLRASMPAPFQTVAEFHPDRPIQQRTRLENNKDIQAEERLLQRVWDHLRRGQIGDALSVCTGRGQAWRTALLQGMMPFSDKADEDVHCDVEHDALEDKLVQDKLQHTDWTEVGALDVSVTNGGNPWRRIWKEQCWDVAQRNLQDGTGMSHLELAIFGFCAGHQAALKTACQTTWTDTCWGDMHCLKEWFVERLLDDGRREGHSHSGVHLGEGDWGNPDLTDSPEEQEVRSSKLSDRFHGVSPTELDATLTRELRQVFQRLREDLTGTTRIVSGTSKQFALLQIAIMETMWAPDSGDAVLDILRGWLVLGFEGVPCPFLVKQFASYYSTWQQQVRAASADLQKVNPSPSPSLLALAEARLNVDDIVCALVQDLVNAAADMWEKQCLEGYAVELIAEHMQPLSVQQRLEAYSCLLLELGLRCEGDRSKSVNSGPTQVGGASPSPRLQVLRRCLWVFWERHPREVFALVSVLVRRVIQRGDSPSNASGGDAEVCDDVPIDEDNIESWRRGAPGGVARPAQLAVAIDCLVAFWVVVRDRTENETISVDEAIMGLEMLLDHPLEEPPKTRMEFARTVLEMVVLPLVTDTLLCLSAAAAMTAPGGCGGSSGDGIVACTRNDASTKEGSADGAGITGGFEVALATVSSLRDTSLWYDAFRCEAKCAGALGELDWFLALCKRSEAWNIVRRELATAQKEAGATVAGVARVGGMEVLSRVNQEKELELQQRCNIARDALLSWVGLRLSQDQPLLQPSRGMHTLLSEDHWLRLRRMIASSVLLLVLSVFESTQDFDGALRELVVAAAQSPWMLEMAYPCHLRAFVRRLALIPMTYEENQDDHSC